MEDSRTESLGFSGECQLTPPFCDWYAWPDGPSCIITLQRYLIVRGET